MASSAPAVVAPTSFDDLRLGRSAQFVVARLLRCWDSRNIKKQGEFMGITLLFLDEQVLFHLFTIKLFLFTIELLEKDQPFDSIYSHVYFFVLISEFCDPWVYTCRSLRSLPPRFTKWFHRQSFRL